MSLHTQRWILSDKQVAEISTLFSWGLRHNPEQFGVELDEQGWTSITSVLQAFVIHRPPFQGRNAIELRKILGEVVSRNNKQRFEMKGDRIRARQGHSASLSVELGLKPKAPPSVLFHGTASDFVASIFSKGIVRQSRQHVHLSDSWNTATDVGSRHGDPVVLKIDAKRMNEDGFAFYLTENGVWLTDDVPVEYIFSDHRLENN
jgi:putative RNA 2'-phosphotransferase